MRGSVSGKKLRPMRSTTDASASPNRPPATLSKSDSVRFCRTMVARACAQGQDGRRFRAGGAGRGRARGPARLATGDKEHDGDGEKERVDERARRGDGALIERLNGGVNLDAGHRRPESRS